MADHVMHTGSVEIVGQFLDRGPGWALWILVTNGAAMVTLGLVAASRFQRSDVLFRIVRRIVSDAVRALRRKST